MWSRVEDMSYRNTVILALVLIISGALLNSIAYFVEYPLSVISITAAIPILLGGITVGIGRYKQRTVYRVEEINKDKEEKDVEEENDVIVEKQKNKINIKNKLFTVFKRKKKKRPYEKQVKKQEDYDKERGEQWAEALETW